MTVRLYVSEVLAWANNSLRSFELCCRLDVQRSLIPGFVTPRALFRASLVAWTFSTTQISHSEESVTITYSGASSIYARMLQKIFKAHKLDEPTAKKVEYLVLAWVHFGPCKQPWTKEAPRALGNVDGANPDLPDDAALLASVGFFMRANDGRSIEEFACRYAADRLKQIPAP